MGTVPEFVTNYFTEDLLCLPKMSLMSAIVIHFLAAVGVHRVDFAAYGVSLLQQTSCPSIVAVGVTSNSS